MLACLFFPYTNTFNSPLGRDDEITILKDSLSRKDAELKQVERKLQALHGAYIDLSEK